MAVFISCLLAGNRANAQVNLLKFDFEDAPGTTTTSDTSLGGASVALVMQANNGTAFDGHGVVGSGVLGGFNATRALDFSIPAGQGGAGPVACATNTALGFGNITAFTATIWFKQDSLLPGNIGQRIFLLGADAGLADFGGVVNSIALKFQTANQIYVGINTTATFTGQATFAANLPTNKWLFIAILTMAPV